jgi:hypothetical protein
MRPTRTARHLLIATAIAAVWAGVAGVGPAWAEPVPAACPHVTVVGDIDFIDAVPEGAFDSLRSIAWDCMIDAPDYDVGLTGFRQYQFDLADASYADFVALVEQLFAEPNVHFDYGSRALDGVWTNLDDSLTAWPSDAPAELTGAEVAFSYIAPTRTEWVHVRWLDEVPDASHWESTWVWGGDSDGDGEAAFEVRRTAVVPMMYVDLSWHTYEAVPALSGTGIADPSSVSQLKTVLDAVPTPLQTVVLAGTGTLLTLLVGLPGALLAGVLALRWERWFGWARRPADAVRKVTSRPQPVWLFWIGVVVASVLAGFVDPQFGLNWMSLRLVLTFIAAFSVFNVGAWLVITRVVRRLEPDSPAPTLNLRYGSLVLLLVGVVLSRLLSLQPGIVLGVIAGLVYATVLVASRRALVVLVGSGFAAAAGVLAWIIYSVLAITLGGADNAFAVGVTEFFGGITIQGISALPIALLPFAVLDGGQLFGWNRAYWAITYFLASGLFLLVMLTVPGGVPGVPGDFLRWLGLYLAFAIIATAIWGIDRLVERRREAPGLPESEAAR